MNDFDSNCYDTQSWPNPHTGRLYRLIQKGDILDKLLNQESLVTLTKCAISWIHLKYQCGLFCFLFFLRGALFLFQRAKRQSKPTKPVVSLCIFVLVLSIGCSVALTAVQILFCSVGCTTWTAQEASQSGETTTTASQDIFSNSTVGFFLQVTSVCSSSLVTYSNSWANHSFPKYHWGGSLMWLSLHPACRLVLH